VARPVAGASHAAGSQALPHRLGSILEGPRISSEVQEADRKDGRGRATSLSAQKGEQRRLRKLELSAARRRAARKPGGPKSKGEQKAYQQIAALRARQARRRRDWLHKTTTDLAKNHGLIVVEELLINNMVRSARGTIDHPGSNVKAKTALNRSILRMAWGKAERMLSYKAPACGGILLEVCAAYSSQTCVCCGQIAAESRRVCLCRLRARGASRYERRAGRACAWTCHPNWHRPRA
jgi:IS605 OrfB family transposase